MNPNRPPDRLGQLFAALGKSVCYLALFIGMQTAVMLPLMVSAITESLLGESVVDEEAVLALLSADVMTLTLISGLLTIAVVLAFYLIRRKKLSEALMLRPVPVPTLLTASSLVPALYAVVAIVLVLLPEAWTESYSEASAGIDSGTVIGVIAVVAVAPVVEEFIFRGLMMNRLSQVMPGWLAVVLSAAVFGLCHGNVVWFCYTFLLGAFFGFADLRAGSIWPSILGHVAFNAIGQIFTFIPETDGAVLAALGVLAVIGVTLPILNRKAIAALFRPVPKAAPVVLDEWELPTEPGTYEYDPWDE